MKISTKPKDWTADRLINEFGSELGGCDQVELEFSVRLKQGKVEGSSRFSYWIERGCSSDFAPISRLLKRLDAPQSVVEAQEDTEFQQIQQGIGIDLTGACPEFRLYLHGRSKTILTDHYQGWHWHHGAVPQCSNYTFHFLPETPSGQRPLDMLDVRLRPAFFMLLAEKRFQQSSGFWIRKDKKGNIDQLDLAFPWCPVAGTLTGLLELAKLLQLNKDDSSYWRELSIRHVAVRVGSVSPIVTLYVSASLNGSWPSSEAELQQQVSCGARAFNQEVEERIYQHIPPLMSVSKDMAESDSFYDGSLSIWQSVLGGKLHYHAGLFDKPELDPDDVTMEAALDRAVTELYPFLTGGGHIYDIGCGWGGALGMWIRDLGCYSLGLTNSKDQFRYISQLGLPVRWGDAEHTLPPGHFDCVILLESLSHIHDKAWLMQTLRLFASRLVMRVNCQDSSTESTAFGGTMQMISSTQLQKLLKNSGWQIRHWRNRRHEALPSVAVWHKRLQYVPYTNNRHIEVLRNWCDRVMTAPKVWAQHNPLIEVVAD